ncbi:DUF3445 domain-containing protein [Aquicoccus sp. SCR17]|nr:DUF3445 domain-containing protein [Carideicomes alvinocaridis]
MAEILQSRIPHDLSPRRLPGIQPLELSQWLQLDDAYFPQMALRRELIATQRETVLALDPAARPAAEELLEVVLGALDALPGFVVEAGSVLCPDGWREPIDRSDPLAMLGRMVQEDLCLLEKRGADQEHVLTGAVLCFPASWRLDEKFMRPLTAIHDPVAEYDADLAKRVQRLFDAVRPDRPLWRSNALRYAAPDLHQPRSVTAPREKKGEQPYLRSERQSVLRLPESGAAVFSIHTYVVRAEGADAAPAAGDAA